MEEHTHFMGDEGAVDTLDRISAGGRHLLTITHQRIGDTLNALGRGDFRAAAQHLAEAGQVMQPLASAQTYIAVAGDAELIETRNLKDGMVIVDVGEIEEVEVEECGLVHCHGHVKCKVGEHELKFDGGQEVYIEPQ